MDDDADDDADTVEDVLRGFLQANREAFKADPALALERIDRFLGRFPELPEADRARLRRALLGGVH